MPLTRFPDLDDKRVFLSTVPCLNLPPSSASAGDRISIVILWLDQDSDALRELNEDFVHALIERGGLSFVIGGSGAELAATIVDNAAAETPNADRDDEAVAIWADPAASLEDLLFTAAEEAMPPDAFADQPWDLIAWARSGDPAVPRLRDGLGRLGALIDERYELGGEADA